MKNILFVDLINHQLLVDFRSNLEIIETKSINSYSLFEGKRI